jgi:predicted CoA-binding protein
MEYKNWVVAGDVHNETKYAGRIYKKLNRRGYNVVGMHPLDSREDVYNSFADLKNREEKFEVLNLVVNPARGLQIVQEAYEYGIRLVMAQPGARSHEIRDFCEKNGMEYVEGCTLVELSY